MSLFFEAFVFIFLAALPGRTTFLMILMAARGRPFEVLLGAILAFFAQSAISVGLGNLLSFIPPSAVKIIAGLLLLYFAFHFWRESEIEIKTPRKANTWRSAFLIIFAAEWGDVSQVAIATFAAQNSAAPIIFLSALTALWLISVISVLVGSHLVKIIEPRLVQKFAALAFGCAGLYLLISSWTFK